MALTYNGARMTTATTGTGTITLGSAVSGYMSFAGAGVADGNVVAYGILDGANFECGTGTYTASGTTLTRTVTTSTNSNTAISLSGNAQVFLTVRKEDYLMMSESQSQNLVYAAPSGSSGAPSFRALVMNDVPVSGWVLLNTLTASSSASLDDTTSLTSTYINYYLVLDRVLPATNAVNGILLVHSGGSFQTTSYSNQSGTGTADIHITSTASTVSNTASGGGVQSIISIINPSSTAAAKQVNSIVSYWTGSTLGLTAGSGFWGSTSVVDGFSFKFSSGNITSGTIKVYGTEP